MPRPMVVEPPFDRSGNIERQFQVQRIGANTIDDKSRRQILHDEADRERNKGAWSQSADRLEDEDVAEARRQWQQRIRDAEDDDRDRQNPPWTEYAAQPGRRRPDHHLPDGEGRRYPGALVKAGMDRTANVGEAEGGNAAVQGRDNGA